MLTYDYEYGVNKLSFDKTDPFNIGKFYFDSVKDELTHDDFAKFSEHCVQEHFKLLHFRETCASIFYNEIAKQISNTEFQNYFLYMQEEEMVHAICFKALSEKIFGESAKFSVDDVLVKAQSEVNSNSIVDLVLRFFIYEIKFMSVLTTFYKFSISDDKKNLIGNLLSDESQHIQDMSNMLKSLMDDVDTYNRARLLNKYLQISNEEQYFLKSTVEEYFKGRVNSTELIGKVYESEFHKSFHERFMRNVYRHFSKLDISTTYESFVERIG